ncbi:MAG TPA: spermidine/putrescine ABC transporter substrate-binding protein [Chroococcidiopsis sp.]
MSKFNVGSSFGRSLGRYPSRRQFLQFSAAAVSAIALSNCNRDPGAGEQSASPQDVSQATGDDAKTLHIYTWADYNSEEIYTRFTSETGIKVVADIYDSNETMLAKLQAGGGTQYSVIYPSDYMVRQMVDLGLLNTLDAARIQGQENLLERWKNPAYDANNAHSIPFNSGTTGFIYNTKIIKEEPQDWNFLWDNADALKGKITLLDDVRETFGMALKSLGYSLNSTDPAQIKEAYQKLVTLKPSIAQFITFGWEDQLIAGDLALCMTYSLLGNGLPTDNPHLTYVIPQSGTSVWTDAIAIPKTAPNLEAAYAWINFMLKPENAAEAAKLLSLTPPNAAAIALLPSELKDNPKLFPTEQFLSKAEGITPVDDATSQLYDKYWTDLRSA